MRVLYILFFVFLLSYACQSSESNDQNRSAVACRYKVLAKDSIVLPASYITNYKIFRNLKMKDSHYQIGYNAARDRLEFINLTTKIVAPEKNIDLSKIDEIGIKEVNDFLYHADDAIFIVSETAIYKIDQKGTLQNKWLINRINSPLRGINFEEYTLSPNSYCPIYYDKEDDHLFIHCRSLLHSQFDVDYFKTPIMASIDLKNNQANLLPIHYPEYMLEERYGLTHRPRFSFTEEQALIGFDHQSASTIFNFSKQSTQDLSIPTLNAPQKAKPLTGPDDPVVYMEHTETNPSYLNHIYLPAEEIFVRPFFAPRPADRTFGRGKIYLSIWSPDDTTVRELEIPGYLNPQHYFVSSKGISFKNMQESTDETLVINYINYDCP